MTSTILWFLAQVRPNGFDRAIINLERQGLKTFMPVQEMMVRRGRSNQLSKTPLFPGYIFVGTDDEPPQWSIINNTYGVSRLVSFGQNDPIPLPDDLIMGIKARCNADDILLPPDDLKIGEEIRATSGPFIDYIATIEVISNERRLGILFDFMGKKTRATIGLEDIEKVSKTSPT